jgi:hypothetical protein
MPDPVAPPIALAFQHDVPCIHCTYNLRGIRLETPCPECGRFAYQSLDALCVAVPADIARVRLGVLLMALAASVVPMFTMVSTAVMLWLTYARGSRLENVASVVSFTAMLLVGPATACLGAFLAARVPRRSAHWSTCAPLAHPVSGMALRITAATFASLTCVLLLIAAAFFFEFVYAPQAEETYIPVVVGLVLLAMAAWAGRNVSACAWFSALSRRAGLRGFSRLFSVMRWISLVALIGIVLVGTVSLTLYILDRLSLLKGWSGGSSVLDGLGLVFAGIYNLCQLGVVGWMVLWPIVLFVFYFRLRGQLARARANAEGLLGPAEYGESGPTAPPTRPTRSPALR